MQHSFEEREEPLISCDEEHSRLRPSLFDEANEMLLASAMIYALVDLRRLATEDLLDDALLKLPFSTKDIGPLVLQNAALIRNKIGKGGTALYLKAFELIENGEAHFLSSDVIVLDDERKEEELVYGILVNVSRRRITVVFRGAKTRKDWYIAANPFLKEIPNPVDSEATLIGVHKGIHDYLATHTRTGNSKCTTILSQVHVLLAKEYPGYSIYVTGHSLGGALATFFAFEAASNAVMRVPGQVTCVTFASPMTGNLSFRRAFQALEEQRRLRCLRVVNHLDLFTKLPDRSSSSYIFALACGCNPFQYVGYNSLFFLIFQDNLYRHVGMKLKLFRHGRYSIKRSSDEPDSWLTICAQDWRKHLFQMMQLLASILTIPFAGCCDWFDSCCKLEDFSANHQCYAYMNRLQPLSDTLRGVYLDDLYETGSSPTVVLPSGTSTFSF